MQVLPIFVKIVSISIKFNASILQRLGNLIAIYLCNEIAGMGFLKLIS